jgi:hypothetical protein
LSLYSHITTVYHLKYGHLILFSKDYRPMIELQPHQEVNRRHLQLIITLVIYYYYIPLYRLLMESLSLGYKDSIPGNRLFPKDIRDTHSW